MSIDPGYILYGLLALGVIGAYLHHQRRRESRAQSTRQAAIEAGLDQPASLHPKIDPLKCIGCGACVAACPEGEVLGRIRGKAVLISPTECIGHGACRAACPVAAIELVFGTEKRGVDLPHVGPDFQTNVPGIFIAGELGGMGLIRNAIEQGRQAIDEIARLRRDPRAEHDVVIIGAGPAGISASLNAQKHGLRYVTVEQESFGGTVAHFPRHKLVMTQPAVLPGYGRVNFREINKESLLDFWTNVVGETGANISYGERVERIAWSGAEYAVETTHRVLGASYVLLAIGRRGTPRRLDVPGEDLPKVVYRLIDPAQYAGQRVLVVGGGDSALEAAASLVEETDAQVVLAYRGEALGRAKPKNRERVRQAADSGALRLLLSTNVVAIAGDSVALETGGERRAIANDAVIVCAGGILPTDFLRSIGVDIVTKHGTA